MTHLDDAALRRDRDQLMAEAVAVEAQGEKLYLEGELLEQMFERQEGRRVHDPWEDIVADLKGTLATNAITAETEERITTYEVLTIRLGIPVGQQSSWIGRRLRPLMERHGWAYTRLRVENGKPDRGYVRTPSLERLREDTGSMSTKGVQEG
jgi:hypothetical protein